MACDPVMSTGYEGDMNLQLMNPNLLFQTCESNNVQQNNFTKDNILDIESGTPSFYTFMDAEGEDFSGENWQLPLDLGPLEDVVYIEIKATLAYLLCLPQRNDSRILVLQVRKPTAVRPEDTK
ncbi:uncharacterized protein LOC111089286 [Limulus polyphemus]|uniref:Uncharacterized protein LOC111089286 n=1 Tax=Limulus polyphemus TaxID=6850 RepID=A0ABM1TMV8_LIMPO|nr:uncharacterized protein LOC111089286 [Limulus polyphemus]